MTTLRASFKRCKDHDRPALITYTTAGFPSNESTVDILQGMEAGGADLIELGLPFTDPIADGPTIQKANVQALANGATIDTAFAAIKDARSKGLRIPVLLMGYYNPIFKYGEKRFLDAARDAGANGCIIVDFPPEDAMAFRHHCTHIGLSYVPLIAPSTPDARIRDLCSVADSFVYVVSRMGTTGASDSVNPALPDLLGRVRSCSLDHPAVVGFGISTRDHFLSIAHLADGAVIGSQVIHTIEAAPVGCEYDAVKEYCHRICRVYHRKTSLAQIYSLTSPEMVPGDDTIEGEDRPSTADEVLQSRSSADMWFGEYGGQYAPESLTAALELLEQSFTSAVSDAKFWEEYHSHRSWIGVEQPLQLATKLTEHLGGANIWLKREDHTCTGSYHVWNALGQILLAKRMGIKRIISDTGGGDHGIAVAMVCARLGLQCKIYMGASDIQGDLDAVELMRAQGATVAAVVGGANDGTLRDAMNEAFRELVAHLSDSYYVMGSPSGLHPFPRMVRRFDATIGEESKDQLQQLQGKLPDAVVACIGLEAMGMFRQFHGDDRVALIGVEAGGDGHHNHSAVLSKGGPGILHGAKTYVLQDEHGQIAKTHSSAASLNYAGAPPELASWKDTGRISAVAVADSEALMAAEMFNDLEGAEISLASAHNLWAAMDVAKTIGTGKDIIVCLSGRPRQK